MLLRKILAALAASTATAAALAAPSPAAAQTTTGARPAAAPASAAPPAAAAANPVIVVAGLSTPALGYEPLAARLRVDGFRVWIYQLPGLGFGDIADSARAFSAYVDQVRAATGAARVDLVAHSEGGLVSRYLIRNLGGGTRVGRYVSLGTPHYGTYVADIAKFLGLGSCLGIVACQQMAIGSSFLTALNDGDDTPGDVRWTAVRTLQDELVRPVDNATLADGATNVLIQSWCPLRIVGHLGLVLDGTTYTVVRGALTDSPVRPDCYAL
ncbi:Alpha/beta hydrolase family protein [Micromonospora haikouensis]|uniref:Alpha/beta hydrolase family protein n=1 Tax=Micromonospora haikouensis TaxID=686309 RepID=A0A1C4VJ66_9ACTN|nr:alpha/beta fold hydrolase [Micromonospora haikouensis]SCE83851.1 Alpha/beta hydrolase family protein [Micromonospora haikouensis]